MQAVVMAGGGGARLRPLTTNRPKPMVPIVDKPCLGHIFELLKRHGIEESFVTLQYMASVTQDSYGDGGGVGMRLRYSVEETPLGTGGSVRQIVPDLDGTFLVISGDALTDIDLSKVIAFHRERNAAVTLTLVHVPNPLEYGVVITGEDGRITKFLEKPSWGEVFSDTINTGIYVIEPRVLEHFAVGEVFDFSKDLFPRLLSEGEPLFGYVAEGYWTDVGSIAEYARANADLLRGKVKGEDLGNELMPGVWTAGNVDINESAKLTGPIFLGEGVKIGPHAEIIGPTVLRDYVSVDVGAVIDSSIVWRNTYIGERSELHGAIVGRQCALKSRVILEEGSVIGDHTIVGDHARVRAQVKVWPDKQLESGAVIGSSLIWGAQGRRALLGRFGVTGIVNIDLTPEFVARLGAAYASTLKLAATITMNRDQHRSSRMLKRGLMSGIVSAGVHVADLSQAPLPIGRFHTRRIGAAGGVHGRAVPPAASQRARRRGRRRERRGVREHRISLVRGISGGTAPARGSGAGARGVARRNHRRRRREGVRRRRSRPHCERHAFPRGVRLAHDATRARCRGGARVRAFGDRADRGRAGRARAARTRFGGGAEEPPRA